MILLGSPTTTEPESCNGRVATRITRVGLLVPKRSKGFRRYQPSLTPDSNRKPVHYEWTALPLELVRQDVDPGLEPRVPSTGRSANSPSQRTTSLKNQRLVVLLSQGDQPSALRAPSGGRTHTVRLLKPVPLPDWAMGALLRAGRLSPVTASIRCYLTLLGPRAWPTYTLRESNSHVRRH